MNAFRHISAKNVLNQLNPNIPAILRNLREVPEILTEVIPCIMSPLQNVLVGMSWNTVQNWLKETTNESARLLKRHFAGLFFTRESDERLKCLDSVPIDTAVTALTRFRENARANVLKETDSDAVYDAWYEFVRRCLDFETLYMLQDVDEPASGA